MENKKKDVTESYKIQRTDLVKSQAGYTGKQHADLVEVTIIADGKYVKKGQVKKVHPTMALILKEKGLIADLGKSCTRAEHKQKDVTIDV